MFLTCSHEETSQYQRNTKLPSPTRKRAFESLPDCRRKTPEHKNINALHKIANHCIESETQHENNKPKRHGDSMPGSRCNGIDDGFEGIKEEFRRNAPANEIKIYEPKHRKFNKSSICVCL